MWLVLFALSHDDTLLTTTYTKEKRHVDCESDQTFIIVENYGIWNLPLCKIDGSVQKSQNKTDNAYVKIVY